ncbi:Expansin-like A2, partial [Glycine soja]
LSQGTFRVNLLHRQFCVLLLFVSSYTACDRCLHQSKASYFSKAYALSSGACRYESLALDISGGHLAAGVASLFIDGVGCGACFQFGPSKSSDSTSLRDIEDLIYKFLVFMLEHSMREKDG